ncbi:TRAP transporter TatT component family protein [Agitococcus lubricus]|uniref:TRAP transporter TatT component family protein n=1 Tax=Agitococcus lubricus TaxID=1077255 RepID=A0A2T5IYL2_9GAMM|nr:TRAP transporter TatT component family protein [Agitococcus lubricus]PTQ89081.1 TRAP transporter TatT component family protein [Agitococcus lubricus]
MMNTKKKLFYGSLFWCLLSGCSTLIADKAQEAAETFSSSVLNSDDPATVAQGLPAYLLMVDAIVQQNPEQTALLNSAASLNSAYASSLAIQPQQIQALHNKALKYAFAALCLENTLLCQPRQLPIDTFTQAVHSLNGQQVNTIFTTASTWAAWIQANSSDWGAIADLARVELMMKRVIELEPSYQQGNAYLYLGVLATVLTPALGGRPEEGKRYFEQAISLSNGHNLMAKLYYAKNYARGIFDRELHDRLLNEVLAADPHAKDLTLSNILAQQQAKALLASADDYF